MIMDIEEAKGILRVDGNDLDTIIFPLIDAIPEYLENTTGKRWDSEPINPLAKTTAGFILQLWFEPQGDEARKLKRTINGLLSVLTSMARG